ncbi:hypothetical protein H2198_005923 [Neophaeococcomyces mojaviensis]|uniref:Uncharacterized protein n=1 Tax=Neophaeococcomyces mojaviensis TaxID=3383035 RepID=A0ACC3A518_9EURO|nr:hypothetical protein H2198_005923 [Knufia sp. JES_112]
MAEISYNEDLQPNLRGRAVVLTGGAQGIGAATVRMFQTAGAHVIFGDWAADKGRSLEAELTSGQSAEAGNVHFQQLDVRDYSSQVALFDLAHQKYGCVDVAVSCAAVGEPGGWFEPKVLDLESVRKEPLPIKNAIDINLTSVISFCRIALAYMSHDITSQPNGGMLRRDHEDTFSKSIVLVSSIAGITEAPGLFAYSSAKHGVIGMMRALRPWAPTRYNVRANAICPWATDTQLLAGVRERWVEEKLPMNQPEDVAKMILQSAADSNMNGKAIFVTGGRGFDTEEGYDRTLPQWMGEQNARMFSKGQEILGLGDDWT